MRTLVPGPPAHTNHPGLEGDQQVEKDGGGQAVADRQEGWQAVYLMLLLLPASLASVEQSRM